MKTHLLLITLLLVVALLATLGGRLYFLPQDLFGELDALGRELLFVDRLPRVVIGATLGAILGLCGLLLQATLANPLASPFTLGTSAGASLGVMMGLTFVGPSLMVAPFGLGIWALGGALAITLPVVFVATRRAIPAEAVLLTGVAFSFAALAITSGMHFLATDQTAGSYIRWTLGNLGGNDWKDFLRFVLPAFLLLLAISWPLRWRLEAMLAGEAVAQARGVDTSRVRAIIVFAVALAVAASVALCGPIGFVGLVIPHIAIAFRGASAVKRYWVVMLLGAITLVLCDFIGKEALAGANIPIGVVTAAIGTPAFIAMLVMRFRSRPA